MRDRARNASRTRANPACLLPRNYDRCTELARVLPLWPHELEDQPCRPAAHHRQAASHCAPSGDVASRDTGRMIWPVMRRSCASTGLSWPRAGCAEPKMATSTAPPVNPKHCFPSCNSMRKTGIAWQTATGAGIMCELRRCRRDLPTPQRWVNRTRRLTPQRRLVFSAFSWPGRSGRRLDAVHIGWRNHETQRDTHGDGKDDQRQKRAQLLGSKPLRVSHAELCADHAACHQR